MNFGDDRLPKRFWSKVVPCPMSGCWLWTGSANNGYGATYHDGRHAYAHRWSYETFVGAVPTGLDLDHLCRVRPCVNPAHLEPVTRAENGRRSPIVRDVCWKANLAVSSAMHRAKTHCPQGHAYTPENTRAYGGKRFCVSCGRVNVARYQAANREMINKRNRDRRAARRAG